MVIHLRVSRADHLWLSGHVLSVMGQAGAQGGAHRGARHQPARTDLVLQVVVMTHAMWILHAEQPRNQRFPAEIGFSSTCTNLALLTSDEHHSGVV